jgi:hypothetical protein
MNIIVTSCHDCPFCNNDIEQGNSCNLPGNDVEDSDMPSYKVDFIPQKCKLQDEDIIVVKI